jgi:hypothetical protein
MNSLGVKYLEETEPVAVLIAGQIRQVELKTTRREKKRLWRALPR